MGSSNAYGMRMNNPYSKAGLQQQMATMQAQQVLPSNIDMTTTAGQQTYKRMSKDQRAAFDAAQQQKTLNSSEAQMLKILKQQPGYKSAMTSPEFAQYKTEAYGTGPLAEYEAMRKQAALAKEQGSQKLQQQLGDELQNLSVGQAGQTANAYSQLAQSGGLSGGSRERVAGSMGQQALASRQAQRLQNQRQGQDLESQFNMGQQDLLAKESGARRSMQNTYMDMLAKDTAGQSAFEQANYGKKADVLAGMAKARSDAQMNAYRK